MNVICLTALLVFPSLLVFGQQFEVASIKPSAESAQGRASAGLHIDGQMVRYSALSLKFYLGMAYSLKNYQISVPDWMASGRWDIIAKLPEGTGPKQAPQMLQALLSDRFHMKMHRETKKLPVYALIIGKGGLKLKELHADPEAQNEQKVAVAGSGAGATVSLGNGSHLTFGNNKLEGEKLTMAALAEALARFADRPVIDMTDLKGNYDFTMDFSPEDFRAMMIRAAIAQGTVVSPKAMKLAQDSSCDTLFNAVEKLGLKLDPRNAPVEMLVIDQSLKTPTEN